MPWPEINPSNFNSRLTVADVGTVLCDAVKREDGWEILVGFDKRFKEGPAQLDGNKITIKSVRDPRGQADDDHAGAWMILHATEPKRGE